MTLATSQGNQPAFATLPTKLPATQPEWEQFVGILQAWQRGLQTVTWQTPTLQNGWVNYGSPYEPAGYYMDATGRVHLRGLVKSGTSTTGTPIFTLPTGYAPSYDVIVASVTSADVFAEVRVLTTGVVAIWAGNNAWLSLSSISFSIAP